MNKKEVEQLCETLKALQTTNRNKLSENDQKILQRAIEDLEKDINSPSVDYIKLGMQLAKLIYQYFVGDDFLGGSD